MENVDAVIDNLVAANRILAHENIVDAFGHVSQRHPENPARFLLSRARAPEIIEAGDIMEFTLEGEPVDAKGRRPYLERFIHGAIYEARPEIQSVVHNHSHSVIPFGVTGEKLRPIMHTCAKIGFEIPVWDIAARFGDTNMLVTDMAMGRDLAKSLGKGASALMRGHGCVVAGASLQEAVYIAIYLDVNAKLQMSARHLGGDIKFLSRGEVETIIGEGAYVGLERAWEVWCRRAGVARKALT
jgi:ribulose-5-phosphate 4-epimerase/fuculose-1-phosphate aldolase